MRTKTNGEVKCDFKPSALHQHLEHSPAFIEMRCPEGF
jgi:hypothetical protein